jgi:hypothetical protein
MIKKGLSFVMLIALFSGQLMAGHKDTRALLNKSDFG